MFGFRICLNLSNSLNKTNLFNLIFSSTFTSGMPPKKKAKPESQEEGDRASSEERSEKASNPKRVRKKSTAIATENDDKIQKVLKNQSSAELKKQCFENNSTTIDGLNWNLKISSWNVAGLRAWIKKEGLEYLKQESPDILCLQETKCSKSKLPQEAEVTGYHAYWSQSETEGHAGLGLYTKVKPLSVNYNMGIPEFDKDGRLIIAEYEKFFLINVYVPNAGRKLVTLPRRLQWNPVFEKFVKDLDAEKPTIICGDMNVAHHEIDIANPKSNKRNAGFTQEERDGFSGLLESVGLIDCFRHKYPELKGAYTFWSYMGNARKKNVGWRLDYCLLSRKLSNNLCDCCIRSEVYGSDHCPVVSFLHL